MNSPVGSQNILINNHSPLIHLQRPSPILPKPTQLHIPTIQRLYAPSIKRVLVVYTGQDVVFQILGAQVVALGGR